MQSFNIHSDDNELVIRLDKNTVPTEVLLKIAHRLRVEYLAQKAGFSGDFSELIDKVDESWWEENGSDFLKNVVK